VKEIGGKQVLTEIEEIVSPAHTALIVVDVQNDCCSPSGAFAERGADLSLYGEMIPRLQSLIEAARETGVLVVFIQATTLPDYRSQSPAQLLFEERLRESYPGGSDDDRFDFCLPGTWGHDFVADVRPAPGELVVQKHRSSAFVGTNLDLLLRSNEVKTVVITGCTTEGCVDSTIRDAGFLDYYPVAVTDCIASDNHQLHEAALLILGAYRAFLTDSPTVAHTWRATARAEDQESALTSPQGLS
jgi:nicotinamidase-related amidase